MKTAIILAGGFGTRLRSVVEDLPKPMAPINGRPFLAYCLDYLSKYNISKVILATGYLSNIIEEYFGQEFKGMEICYSVEDKPLGTGGAIAKAMTQCEAPEAFILNGDTLFDIDLDMLMTEYNKLNADIMIALKPMVAFDRYGSVTLNDAQRIVRFEEKTFKEEGLINGGVYYLSKSIFNPFKDIERFSFEKDLLESYLDSYKINGLPFDEYFIDIGIPSDYEKAQHELT